MKRIPMLLLALLGVAGFGMTTAGSAAPVPGQNLPAAQITLELDLSAQGSTLMSIPLDLGSQDVGRFLEKAGLAPSGIHGWSAREQRYVQLNKLRPGEGFLIARRGPGKVAIRGQRVADAVVEVSLEKGWNLIGVPFEAGIPLASLRIKVDREVKSFKAATESKWVGAVHALVDGSMAPVMIDDKNATLVAWRGYWLYAYQPCLLQFPSALAEEKTPKGKKPAGRR